MAGQRIKVFQAGIAENGVDQPTQTAINTSIFGTNNGILLKRVELSVDVFMASTMNPFNNKYVMLSLMRSPIDLTSFPYLPREVNVSKDNLICQGGFSGNVHGGGVDSHFAVNFPSQWTWEAPIGFLLVDSELTLLLDSVGTGIAMEGAVRIYYQLTQLTALEKLQQTVDMR